MRRRPQAPHRPRGRIGIYLCIGRLVLKVACVPRAQATFRDRKKLADKERKQVEEAARAKEAALRDDDNVFDVAYEQQGGGGADGGDVLSATDIKVPPAQGTAIFIGGRTHHAVPAAVWVASTARSLQGAI